MPSRKSVVFRNNGPNDEKTETLENDLTKCNDKLILESKLVKEFLSCIGNQKTIPKHKLDHFESHYTALLKKTVLKQTADSPTQAESTPASSTKWYECAKDLCNVLEEVDKQHCVKLQETKFWMLANEKAFSSSKYVEEINAASARVKTIRSTLKESNDKIKKLTKSHEGLKKKGEKAGDAAIKASKEALDQATLQNNNQIIESEAEVKYLLSEPRLLKIIKEQIDLKMDQVNSLKESLEKVKGVIEANIVESKKDQEMCRANLEKVKSPISAKPQINGKVEDGVKTTEKAEDLNTNEKQTKDAAEAQQPAAANVKASSENDNKSPEVAKGKPKESKKAGADEKTRKGKPKKKEEKKTKENISSGVGESKIDNAKEKNLGSTSDKDKLKSAEEGKVTKSSEPKAADENQSDKKAAHSEKELNGNEQSQQKEDSKNEGKENVKNQDEEKKEEDSKNEGKEDVKNQDEEKKVEDSINEGKDEDKMEGQTDKNDQQEEKNETKESSNDNNKTDEVAGELKTDEKEIKDVKKEEDGVCQSQQMTKDNVTQETAEKIEEKSDPKKDEIKSDKEKEEKDSNNEPNAKPDQKSV